MKNGFKRFLEGMRCVSNCLSDKTHGVSFPIYTTTIILIFKFHLIICEVTRT